MASSCSFEALTKRVCSEKAPDADVPLAEAFGIRWFRWCSSGFQVTIVILILAGGISFGLHRWFPKALASPSHIRATLQEAQKFLGSLATFLGLLAAAFGFFLTWLDTAVDRTAERIMQAAWRMRNMVARLEKEAAEGRGEMSSETRGLDFWRRKETLERLWKIVGWSYAPAKPEGWEKERICEIITTIQQVEKAREENASKSESGVEVWDEASIKAIDALFIIYYGMIRLLVHRHIAPRLRRILRRLVYLLILMSGFVVAKIFAAGVVTALRGVLGIQGWWLSTGIVTLVIGVFVVILCMAVDFLEIVHLQGHLTFLVLPVDIPSLERGEENNNKK